MSNPIERLNNAIALLDAKAMADMTTPAGSRKAIHDLALHWAKWFATDERWGWDKTAVQAKLERYAKWYGRAYLIASPRVKTMVPTPEEATPQFSELLAEQRRRWVEGMEDAGRAGVSSAVYVASKAASLAESIADKAVGASLGLGLVAVGLAAVYLSNKR